MKALLALVLFAPSLALAAPKLPLSSTHTPPVILDEASFHLEMVGQSDAGWQFRTHVEMTGWGAATDSAKVVLRKGAKVLATIKCDLNRDSAYASGTCEDRNFTTKEVGPLEADLIYWDDKAEKDFLVRTMKFTAVHKKAQWHTWGYMADDTLGTAWMYMGTDEATDSTYRKPHLYLWFATGDYLKGSLRCKVDGKKEIPDITMSEQGGSDTEEIEFDHSPLKGARQTFKWAKKKYSLDITYGKRDTLKWDLGKKMDPDTVLADNPGAWMCKLRHDGKAIRELYFNVDKDGMIMPDEIQTAAKNGIPVVSPRVVLIDVRLTKDSATFDKRIIPEAIKKSMPFGLPWPDHPKVKTIHASYPPKSGMPDPK